MQGYTDWSGACMKLKTLDKTEIILTNASHARGGQICSLKAEEPCLAPVLLGGAL